MTTFIPPDNTLTYEGVSVINEWDLLGQLDLRSAEYEVQTLGIMQWVKDNKASYYAAPDDQFCVFEAIDKAKEAGNTIVVVDNLS